MKKTQMPQLLCPGRAATQLRRRKYELVRRFGLPENILGGSVRLRYRRCGRVNCRCAEGRGHEQLVWTTRCEGKQQVEHIPNDWVDDFERFAEHSQAYFDALEELCALNRQLVAIAKAQRGEKKVRDAKKTGSI